MIVLVCGGRDYVDQQKVNVTMSALHADKKITLLIHGAALGVDSHAALWATMQDVSILPFPANWVQHGKAAGPIRNQRMLDEGKPNLVVAFPGGRGTADMIRRALAAGVEVMDIGSS